MRKLCIGAAMIAAYCLVAGGCLGIKAARADEFTDRIAKLEAKNAAKPKADPFGGCATRDCGCTGPADCKCGASCTCAACAAPKKVPVSDDPARPWAWEYGYDGWGWYRDRAAPVYAPPVYYQPRGFFRGRFSGGCSSGSCH